MIQRIHINLQDWRQQQHTQQLRWRLSLLAACLCLAIAGPALWSQLGPMPALRAQRQHNHALQKERNELARQLAELTTLRQHTRRQFKALRLLNELQLARALLMHQLDQIVTLTPADVQLTRLTQHPGAMTLIGLGRTRSSVTHYMARLEQSRWFDQAHLAPLRRHQDSQAIHFSLTIDSRTPKRGQRPDRQAS